MYTHQSPQAYNLFLIHYVSLRWLSGSIIQCVKKMWKKIRDSATQFSLYNTNLQKVAGLNTECGRGVHFETHIYLIHLSHLVFKIFNIMGFLWDFLST